MITNFYIDAFNLYYGCLKNTPSKCKVLKLWVPIPPSDDAQQVSGSTFTTFAMKVEARIGRERTFGSVTVCSAPIHRGW